MDFSIETAALAAACGMGLTAIAFFYLSKKILETVALKWWAISFCAITIDYLMVFFLPFDEIGVLIPLWEAVHATFVSGLLVGILYFLSRKIPFIFIGILWTIIVGWGVFSVIVKPGFFSQTIPATLIASGMTFYSGWILFFHKPIYQEPGYRFAGLALLLWGLNRLNFSLIEFFPWFTPFGYVIALLAALAIGIGLIISVLERQRYRAVLSEAEVKRTTQNARRELEQQVNERTVELQQEIVERKEVEKALGESERKYRILVENANDGIFVAQDGIIKFPNKKTEELTGYSIEELGKMPFDSFIHPEDKKIVRERHERRLRGDKPVSTYSFRILNKTGLERTVQLNTVLIQWDERPATLNFLRDITQQIKIEFQLQQAQKMEAIGTLAGGIAHDFNNILAAIIGYTEMARDDSLSEATVVKDLDKVLEASNRAKGLVQQILAFSRQDETESIFLKPANIVNEAIKMLRPSIPATIEINQNIAPKTGLIFADPTQIHQILMNLCTNAFHAMEETGGKLDISLKDVILSGEDLIHEPNVKDGAFIQLSICDSGSGIAPAIKDKIFDPYFTTKEPGKGTGMGLSMVHGIVKSYGGFISVYSELAEGTAFHVFLPVVEEEVLFKLETTEHIPVGKERILFVDDEEILAEMGKHMLERLGYHVTVRKSSLEALKTFQNQPDQFDVVITDQTMPGMTGVDLARRMLQIRPDIPVILCTGYSTLISEEKAKSMGIREFALKPLSKKDIALLIRNVVDDDRG